MKKKRLPDYKKPPSWPKYMPYNPWDLPPELRFLSLYELEKILKFKLDKLDPVDQVPLKLLWFKYHGAWVEKEKWKRKQKEEERQKRLRKVIGIYKNYNESLEREKREREEQKSRREAAKKHKERGKNLEQFLKDLSDNAAEEYFKRTQSFQGGSTSKPASDSSTSKPASDDIEEIETPHDITLPDDNEQYGVFPDEDKSTTKPPKISDPGDLRFLDTKRPLPPDLDDGPGEPLPPEAEEMRKHFGEFFEDRNSFDIFRSPKVVGRPIGPGGDGGPPDDFEMDPDELLDKVLGPLVRLSGLGPDSENPDDATFEGGYFQAFGVSPGTPESFYEREFGPRSKDVPRPKVGGERFRFGDEGLPDSFSEGASFFGELLSGKQRVSDKALASGRSRSSGSISNSTGAPRVRAASPLVRQRAVAISMSSGEIDSET